MFANAGANIQMHIEHPPAATGPFRRECTFFAVLEQRCRGALDFHLQIRAP